jgi:hypothetical protein
LETAVCFAIDRRGGADKLEILFVRNNCLAMTVLTFWPSPKEYSNFPSFFSFEINDLNHKAVRTLRLLQMPTKRVSIANNKQGESGFPIFQSMPIPR